LIHHENGRTSAETYHLNVHRQVAWLARHEFSVTGNGKELATEHLAMHPFFATDNGKKMPNPNGGKKKPLLSGHNSPIECSASNHPF
jgi:hypothetical protein